LYRADDGQRTDVNSQAEPPASGAGLHSGHAKAVAKIQAGLNPPAFSILRLPAQNLAALESPVRDLRIYFSFMLKDLKLSKAEVPRFPLARMLQRN